MVYRNGTYVYVAAAATVIAALPAALAFRTGADSGYSGGPAGGGVNCTACHEFNAGAGGVELLGVPQRYRAGVLYELTIRIHDPGQAGAGFEISAEGGGGYLGNWMILDADNTQYTDSGFTVEYVTHTRDGVDDSVANWGSNAGSYAYHVAWQAPGGDEGPVTFFAAGNAVNDAQALLGDRYYAAHATIGYAVPGDADGDGDLDLLDFADLQRCFDGDGAPTGEVCAYLDVNGDNTVSLVDVDAWVEALTGPTATLPAPYVLADVVRGGRLYDQWWTVSGVPQPTGDHPLYPEIGAQAGSVTYRCKECHGWDYQGRDGAYGAKTHSHFTGIRGVAGTTLRPRELFDLLASSPQERPHGHNMRAYGMTERDLWDVVKMTLEGVVNTDTHIAADGSFLGDPINGSFAYGTTCISCHGDDGTDLNFGTSVDPEYVGTVANENPWEFLHKVRFGDPGTPMPAGELLHWNAALAADVGAYAATLPPD